MQPKNTSKRVVASVLKSGSGNCLFDKYILEHSLREHPVLAELRQHTIENDDMCRMLTDPIQVQHFQLLLKTLGAKKCIEVGTYTGYNVLSTALTLPKDGLVYALDINEKWVNIGKPFFEKAGVSDKIKIVIGPAVDSLKKLKGEGQSGTFDFVYIDADKFNYELYYEESLELLCPGGIVALDNMLWNGTVCNLSLTNDQENMKIAEYLRSLTDKLHQDMRIDLSFLKIGDGVIICRKK